jgi:WD40 repeat protein
MKNIKNNRTMRLIVLSAPVLRSLGVVGVIFMVNTFAMRMSEAGKKSLKSYIQKVQPQLEQQKAAQEQELQQKRESMRQAGMYLIYGNDTDKGIMVDEKVVNMSRSLAAMIADIGGEINEIPLNYPVAILKLGFGVLSGDIAIHDLSEEELVNVANLFNFLDVAADKMNVFLTEIKEKIIDKNRGTIVTNNEIKQLHPDLQKLLLTENTVDCLKDCIIKKYAKNRGKVLGNEWMFGSVAFSPNGKSIVADGSRLVLWDISDPNNITKHFVHNVMRLGFDPATCPVAFSPNGKSIVSWYSGGLTLWNVSDVNNITQSKTFGQDIFGQDTPELAFSPDGKKIFSCGRRFIVWDISDLDDITSQPLAIDLNGVKAFSPDGKLVALGVYNTLTIFDVSSPGVHKYEKYENELETIRHLAFSSDGKTIVSYGNALSHGNIFLWDISDLNNIKNHCLLNVSDLIGLNIPAIASVMFSHSGKKIALGLGHDSGFILLDIKDPHNIVRIDNFGMSVYSMAFSPDDRQIVTGGEATGLFGKSLMLWTLLTDQEALLVNQIKNYTADQVRLIYQLYFQSLKDQKVALKKGSEEEVIFKTLPQDMQNLLNDLFSLKGWFSGWW